MTERDPEKLVSETERITASAIKIGERLFTGNTHSDAIGQMQEVYPKWVDSGLDAVDGFVTSTGRFVLRDEAGEIAQRARQLDHLDAKEGRFAAEFLDAHQIKELMPKWAK